MTKKDLERATLISRVRDRLEKAGFKYTSSTFPQAFHENAGSSTVTGVDANIGSGSGIEHEQNNHSGRDLKVYLHATGRPVILLHNRCQKVERKLLRTIIPFSTLKTDFVSSTI